MSRSPALRQNLSYFGSRRWCNAVALTLGPAFRNRWVAGFLPEVARTSASRGNDVERLPFYGARLPPAGRAGALRPKRFNPLPWMKRFFSNTAIMSTKRIAFKVDGEVQGVNFRSSAQKQAKSIGVTGWVSNASDGTVQGEAQGSEDAIEKFVQHLHKGPSAASVSRVEQSDISTKSGESGFKVQ